MTEFSDELLMAYIDGQLDKPQASVVSRVLHHDEGLARRVRRLQDNQARFLELFGALVRDGASFGTRSSGGTRARREQGQADAGAGVALSVVALLLIIGASLGFTVAYYTGLASSPVSAEAAMPAGNWHEDLAELHAYFTPETLISSRDSPPNPELVRLQLAKLPMQPPVPFDFTQNGLRFVRLQSLVYHGNKLMQLVYSGRSDPLVAVYITPGEADEAILPGRFNDVNTVSWGDKGLRFLIAGEMTQEALRALAAVAQAQLNRS